MRLFVAIDVPEALHPTLKKWQGAFPNLKLAREFHLTLQFLGENVPDDKLPTIAQALSTVRFRPFDLTLKSIEPFGDAPGGVWVSCVETPEIADLARQVNEKMTIIHLPPDRPFKAHITLGRYKKLPDPIPEIPKIKPLAFTVKEFHLIKSTTSTEGSTYHRLKAYPSQG